MSTNLDRLKQIIEGALMAAGRPLSIDQLLSLFLDEEQPSRDEIRQALELLQADCENRGIELTEVSTGFRFQVKSEFARWVSRLWEEKPPRYSRAVLETLALIAYRQPITRSEIEDVRGVSVASNIMKSLMEREWIRVVGHRDVPGKPALYGTTKSFLDYFNLKSLSELPPLAEIRSIESIEHELDFGDAAKQVSEEGAANDADADADEAQEDLIPVAEVALAEADATSDEDTTETVDALSAESTEEGEAEDVEANISSEASLLEIDPADDELEHAEVAVDESSMEDQASEEQLDVAQEELTDEFSEDEAESETESLATTS